MAQEDEFPPLHVGIVRLAIKLTIIVAAVAAIMWVLQWAEARTAASGTDGLMLGLMVLLLLSYALLLAVPFVPGIEIGISLLVMKGADVAPLVYAATVLGLSISFLVGRWTPYRWLHGVLADLRLKRACELVEKLAPMSQRERLDHLLSRTPEWLRPMFRTTRYLLLALLLNIPGNAIVGGGGGISFAAGFSRLYRPWLAVLTIALAVLPVPLAVWVSGSDVLGVE